MNNKANRRTLIDPLLLMLKSRRVIIALSTLITGIIVMMVPQLQAVQNEILTLLMTLSLSLIAGLSVEDAVIASKQRPVSDEMRHLLDSATDSIIEEMRIAEDMADWRSGNIDRRSPYDSPN